MIKKLFSLLKNSGIDVYLPAKKPGKATQAYAVVNRDKVEPGKTENGIYTYFTVSLIAPCESYMSIDTIEKKCISALKGSCFKFIGSEYEDLYAEAAAYKRVLTYRVLSRNCSN